MSPFLWFIVGIGVLGVFLTFWLIQKGYQIERSARRDDLGSDATRAKDTKEGQPRAR